MSLMTVVYCRPFIEVGVRLVVVLPNLKLNS